MKQTAFRVHLLATHLSNVTALFGTFFVFATCVGQASDIGGEFAPPPCAYDSSGKVTVGFPPQCTGLASISVLSPSGFVLNDLSFSALPTTGTLSQPFQWADSVSGFSSDLLFTGTLGPLLPLPIDPQLEGNALGGSQFFSRMMWETVVNESHSTWTGFYIELETELGITSTNSDGLSFAQVSRNPQQLAALPTSDVFGVVDFESNRQDSITFSGGNVGPGQSVILNFPISETTALPGFYLLQRPVVLIPEPISFPLVFTGLVLLFCRWRAAAAGADFGTADRAAVPRISGQH